MIQTYIKRLSVLVVFVVIASLSIANLAQTVSGLPVTTVGGRKCYYYEVKEKESIYSVSNQLGVSRDQIVEYNPSAADGLKPKMRLYFPVEVFQVAPSERPAVYAAAAGVTKHVVKRGESIYGIARKYGMSPDYLVKLNPEAVEGLYEGQVLKIVADEAAAPSQESAKPDYAEHTIVEGETLYSISTAYGSTLDAVVDANPALDPINYKAGQNIRVPVSDAAIARHTASAAPVPASMPGLMKVEVSPELLNRAKQSVEPAEDVFGQDMAQAQNIGSTAADTLRVAVLLPFMLDEQTQSRTTQLYTEFFKGMLLAAETLGKEAAQPVNFSFFDTAGSLERVVEHLRNPRVSQADLIVLPDNSTQIARIIDGVSPQTILLNVFAVKDESYANHGNVIQTNTPTEMMYTRAIDAFVEQNAGRRPVFLSRTDGQADKEAFVAELKARLQAEGTEFDEITFKDFLRDSSLEELNPDETPLTFVPVSGSKTEFAKYVQALTTKRNSAETPESVQLWGYPEWVTFRGDSFDEMCNLGVTIYSRFLVNENDLATRNLKRRYHDLYGVEMFDAVPTQGILGYDIGSYIIGALRSKAATGLLPGEFNGVQNSLHLDSPEIAGATGTESGHTARQAEGLTNTRIILMHFRPGGIVESENR